MLKIKIAVTERTHRNLLESEHEIKWSQLENVMVPKIEISQVSNTS